LFDVSFSVQSIIGHPAFGQIQTDFMLQRMISMLPPCAVQGDLAGAFGWAAISGILTR